ncbi:hypothetical protein EDD16DRAFT_1699216 [Pisolithus croceorrhizus]|nr:hypothetical protein EDD16DRAFT_1699216 [Pisolithus croceorrhizus]
MNLNIQPRRPSVQPPAVAASPSVLTISEKMLKSRVSDQSFVPANRKASIKSTASAPPPNTNQNTSNPNNKSPNSHSSSTANNISAPPTDPALADELDYITVSIPDKLSIDGNDPPRPVRQLDKASRILGIAHRKSMEPIPASNRTSIVSTRSVPNTPTQHTPTLPLTSLYVVSGLPKSPSHMDILLILMLSLAFITPKAQSLAGGVPRSWAAQSLQAQEAARKRKRATRVKKSSKGAGALSKAEVAKMLSKTLKLSFPREIEIIASTLQPASTVHTFTFTLPAPSTPLAPVPSDLGLLRSSVLTTDRSSAAPTFAYPYTDDPFAHARPSSAYLGPPSVLAPPPTAPSSPLYEKQTNYERRE